MGVNDPDCVDPAAFPEDHDFTDNELWAIAARWSGFGNFLGFEGCEVYPEVYAIARNFAGRFGCFHKPRDLRQAQHAFRRALLLVAPEVLREFREVIGPIFAKWREQSGELAVHETPDYRGMGIVPGMSLDRKSEAWRIRDDTDDDHETAVFVEAVSKWADKHRLSYDWIVDHAMDEVCNSWESEEGGHVKSPLGMWFATPECVHGCPDIPHVTIGAWDSLECPDLSGGEGLSLPEWDPQASTWTEYRDAVLRLMSDYHARVEGIMRNAGFEKRKVKRTFEHFEWLVHRVVNRKTWNEIGQLYKPTARAESDRSGPDRFQKAVKETAVECGIDPAHVEGRQVKDSCP